MQQLQNIIWFMTIIIQMLITTFFIVSPCRKSFSNVKNEQ